MAWSLKKTNGLDYITYEGLYNELQAELGQHYDRRGRAAARDVEARLAIAWRYRHRLPLENVPLWPITYWRWHWPRFESEVKYQEMLYTFSCYLPTGTRAERQQLFFEERARRVGHIRSDPEFFRYLRNGRIDRDRKMFMGDVATAQQHSEWIALLWAYDRYEDFIAARFPGFSKKRLPSKAIFGRPFGAGS